MADYKAIKGHTIQTVAGDPGTLVDGLIWYDSGAKKIQGSKTAAGAWATGGDINTTRFAGASSGGAPRDTSIIFGGSPPSRDETETYDGSSWTEVGDLNTARARNAGAGATQTAALSFGGEVSNEGLTEIWDGSSWTEVGDLSTPRSGHTGTGTTTAALGSGGKIGENFQTIVEQYDGSSWTEVGDLNTARAYSGLTGITTAALAFGGASPYTANSESFDGSSWTEGSNLNTARAYIEASWGVQTASFAVAGYSPSARYAITEQYDGSSWTEVADIPTATSGGMGGGGSSSDGIYAGGQVPGAVNETYEWSQATAAVTFTSS